MDIESINEMVAEDMAKVEAEFDRNLASDVEMIPMVGRYVLKSGGKRIRPLLCILASRLCGYRGERMVPLAAIMEFIHTATLLHDDVVDSANLRRGQQSANSVWGNSASVLVGDFLFSKSFSLMTTHGDMEILKSVSGATTLMAEGEVLQLLKTCDLTITENEYLEVVINKTAVLLAAACEVGGLLGGVSEEKVKALFDFGMELGIAFQLTDDCLDYIAEEDEFGKAVGTDITEGKITMPLIHAMELCNADERAKVEEIIDKDEPDQADIAYVMELIQKYDGIVAARERALERVALAKSKLEVFDEVPEREAMLALADYVVVRRL
jgi:octaprenyl-diphosphate synthase